MGANTALTFVCFAILSFHIWSSSGEELAKRSLGIQCATATFPRANRYCRAVRLRELQRKQQFFKISGPERNHGFLHLDQPRTRILSYFLTEKFHSHWFNLYFTLMLGRSNSIIVPYLRMKYSKTIFTSYENYTRLAKEMKDVMLAATNYLPQFKYPSRSYNYFTDLLANDRFKRDDFFTQQRLAGLNPMAIRRVVHQGAAGTKIRGLLDRLNTKDFDWDLAIISVTKDRNMYESINKNKVYVVEFPMLQDLTMMPDILYNDRPNRKMKQHVSPIALFAVDPQRNLQVVAIQNGSSSDAHVHTPRDGLLWNISKAQVQISDGFVGQVVEHLMRTHFRMEPVCIALHRHLSALHPLHQILKYHCRGLLPLNAQGAVTLLKELRTIRSLFGYGNQGAIKLLSKEYPKMVWGDIDLDVNIEERGMGDKVQIPYYPYRDDGAIIHTALERFAESLVNELYRVDYFVLSDGELQNMVKELSVKIKGFPSNVRTKRQLSKLIRQTLWIVVQHSMFSFPIAEHGQSPLIFPTKLYEPQNQKDAGDFIQILPGHTSAVLQASLSSGLGTLHYDSFFDYWNELSCHKLKQLVAEAHRNMARVRSWIHNENRKRFQRKQLTNPFMLPDWMPNSIST